MSTDYSFIKSIRDDEQHKEEVLAAHDKQQARALTAVTIIAIREMDNLVLAAANNILSFSDKVPQNNLAYQALRDAGLLRDDGTPADKETLLAALSFEINRRCDAGTFV